MKFFKASEYYIAIRTALSNKSSKICLCLSVKSVAL